MRKAPHWSERWKQIEEQLRSRPHVLLACDFDGTVAPIVARPDEARLPDELRTLLPQLATRGGVTLVMVSGRAVNDVRQRVGIEGVFYCGNHGLEIEGPGINWSSADAHAHRPELADLLAILRRQTPPIEGVVIEDKGLTVTIHWRLVPDESRDELREMVAAAVQSQSGLRLAYGKAAWEILPRVDWNKGTAIRHLLKRFALTTADAICLGDNDTDESSFRALPDGVTLRVGASATSTARFLLNDCRRHRRLPLLRARRAAQRAPSRIVLSDTPAPLFMNETSSHHPQSPQHRERLLNLASLRKKPAQHNALEPATQDLASDGEVGETNVDPADLE